MTKKRIVVMGFMGGIPIAGVVWQHLHYIVGLQRLGHEVYYCEDSARLAYNPETWSYGMDWSYAPKILGTLPATKAARYIQIENKIRAALRYELAAGIPLVE